MRREPADKDLILCLHKDEVSAFDTLYWKYHQPIFRNILKLIKDREVAQDILQEVFSRLWEKRHDLDENQSVSGWLFVVSYNLSVTHLRKSLRESIVRNKISDSAAEHDSPENLILVENQHQLLDFAIQKLSPQKRKVFVLCKIEGKSYEEAANELNISKHTVKEYLTLSVTSIRKHINKYPETWKTAILFVLTNHYFK